MYDSSFDKVPGKHDFSSIYHELNVLTKNEADEESDVKDNEEDSDDGNNTKSNDEGYEGFISFKVTRCALVKKNWQYPTSGYY